MNLQQKLHLGNSIKILHQINNRNKDINKMVLAGWTKQQLVELFVKNSYTGIKAKIQIKKWAKC